MNALLDVTSGLRTDGEGDGAGRGMSRLEEGQINWDGLLGRGDGGMLCLHGTS